MSLKKLAGQTMWYGLSSIAARFLNYLLTPYLVGKLTAANYGEMSLVYACIPFLNVVFTYGMETTYFRFNNNGSDRAKVYSTGSLSLIMTTSILTTVLLLGRDYFAEALRLQSHPEFITWAAWIIALDTLTTLPYAMLRNNGRPRKYAFIRLSGILINIGFTFFFYSVLPGIARSQPDSMLAGWYDPSLGAGYIIIANLIQSGITLLLLLPEFLSVKLAWDKKLWKQMMLYSLPIMIAGFGGMINETFDRIMLNWLAPVGSKEEAKVMVGIYSACYKLSILITLFVQAFRLGAEPFFFQQAAGEDAPKTYARVMRYFVLTVCTMFLAVTLFMDIWKWFIPNKTMWQGLGVVPVLLLANICLGIYYNLSIWYKISGSTRPGAIITFVGAGITLLINFIFIPYFGYVACAWATLVCYGSMMVISYLWGQKVYAVPYDLRSAGGIFLAMMLVFFAFTGLSHYLTPVSLRLAAGALGFLLFLAFILRSERENLSKLPGVRKFLR